MAATRASADAATVETLSADLLLIDFALATRVPAMALDIGRFFHGFALNAAIFASGGHTGTIGMGTLYG